MTEEFEKAMAKSGRTEDPYVLRLYVTGMTSRSTAAFARIKEICDQRLHGRYDLEVIDIYQQPSLASDGQIIAAPTLVKRLPAPPRRLIGYLFQEDRVLSTLDIHRRPKWGS